MSSNCDTCEFCCLVDADCLCLYTRLPKMNLNELAPAIMAANSTLKKVTGYCDLCKNESDFADLIASNEFKIFYTGLIYKYWLILFGSGRPSDEGYVVKNSDEFENYKVKKRTEIDRDVGSYDKILSGYEKTFVELLNEKHPTCCEEINVCKEEKKCGCNNNCTCNKKTNFLDFEVV